jgi:hypothetical protein
VNTIKSVIGVLLICSAFVGPASLAGQDTDVSIAYAGSGFDLGDPDADGAALNIFMMDAKGAFGKSSMTLLSEFALDTDGSVSCPEGFPVPFDLVRFASTLTTANLDQLWGWYTSGYLCMTADLTQWVGETSGVYFGGTGRFQQATGEWTSSYSGANFDLDSGYRTISGVSEGTVTTP